MKEPKPCERCGVEPKVKGKGNKFCERCQTDTTCTNCGISPRGATNTWCLLCNSNIQLAYRKKCIDGGMCVDCGTTPHRPDRRTCQACEDKRKPFRKQHRQDFKAAIVEYLGGCCKDCGLVTEWLDVFDAHHRDPKDKEFTISHELRKDWEVIKAELDKCDLLCSNCHRIRHAKMGGTHHKGKVLSHSNRREY